MSESASLTMLKKAAEQNKAAEAEAEERDGCGHAPRPQKTRGTRWMSIRCPDEELDALVAEQGIEVPDGWQSWDVAAKRSWLQTKFGTGRNAERA